MEIKSLKVTDIFQSRGSGVVMVNIIPYDENGEVTGNRAFSAGFKGIPGLVNEPDFRSEWYGYGIDTHVPFPEVGRLLFNKRGHWRDSFVRRVRRAVKSRAMAAGVKVIWDL